MTLRHLVRAEEKLLEWEGVAVIASTYKSRIWHLQRELDGAVCTCDGLSGPKEA